MSSSEEQKGKGIMSSSKLPVPAEKGNMSESEIKRSNERLKSAKRYGYNIYYAMAYMKTKRHYEKNYPERWRKERLKTPKEMQRYLDKAAASDGFDISGCSRGRCLSGGITEMNPSDLPRVRPYAKFAVAQHIKDQKKEGIKLDLEFKEVVRANYQAVSGGMYYITLKALDNQDGKLKLYRAKVWYHLQGMGAEMKLGKSLLKFSEAPEEPPNKKRMQEKPQTKLPFDIFVEDLRKSPKYESKRNCHVLGVAGNKWRSMSAEDKAKYELRATYAVGVQTRAAKRAKN